MKNMSYLLKILIFIGLFQISVFVGMAQEKTSEIVLSNDSVVELVKAGLSEGIILAKIKNSKSNFDTSSTALVKLKENGVSENIILAMIEAKPKVTEETKEDSESDAQMTLGMKEAVGKRKIFLISVDEEAQVELVKRLTKKGFIFVDNKKSAELVLELTYAEASSKQKVGILRTGNETEFRAKIGKLVVKLNRDSSEFLVYAREYNYAKAANMAAVFGMSAAPPSLRDQIKYFFVDDFLKQMKKAGDKF